MASDKGAHYDVTSTPVTPDGNLNNSQLPQLTHTNSAERINLVPVNDEHPLDPRIDLCNTEQTIICVICLDVVDKSATALPCQHNYFHFSCLRTWLQLNRSCPLCKVQIGQVLYSEQTSNSCRVFYPSNSNVLEPFSERQSQRSQHGSRSRHSRQSRRGSASHQVDASISFRRRIYELKLPSLYVGNNRVSRNRNITPSVIASDPSLILRARKWIRRELRALDPFGQYHTVPNLGLPGSHDNVLQNVEFLLEYIIAILKYIDLKGSAGQAETLLREHIGHENARLFLHELESWLRSPFKTLEQWDHWVQYPSS